MALLNQDIRDFINDFKTSAYWKEQNTLGEILALLMRCLNADLYRKIISFSGLAALVETLSKHTVWFRIFKLNLNGAALEIHHMPVNTVKWHWCVPANLCFTLQSVEITGGTSMTTDYSSIIHNIKIHHLMGESCFTTFIRHMGAWTHIAAFQRKACWPPCLSGFWCVEVTTVNCQNITKIHKAWYHCQEWAKQVYL